MDNNEIMSRELELEKLIKDNSDKYYNGEDCISDTEFDLLVDELRSISPNNELLSKVGWGYSISNKSDKVPHPIVFVKGLSKSRVEHDTKIPIHSVVLPKYDGASVELIYKDGKLIQAISRGDGEYGQDITNKLKYIVPNELVNSKTGDKLLEEGLISITGELIISKSNLEKYFSGEIAHRNLASGFINKKDFTEDECKMYDFVPYRVNGSKNALFNLFNNEPNTVSREYINIYLETIFNISLPIFTVPNNDTTYDEVYNKICTKYNCDGLVINQSGEVVRSYDSNKNINIYNYDEIAWKVNNETAIVEVINITWNHTRTNKFTPLVHFDTVILSGANISKATGYNAKTILNYKIKVGSKIKIIRSGEIIPKIISVFDDNGKEILVNQ